MKDKKTTINKVITSKNNIFFKNLIDQIKSSNYLVIEGKNTINEAKNLNKIKFFLINFNDKNFINDFFFDKEKIYFLSEHLLKKISIQKKNIQYIAVIENNFLNQKLNFNENILFLDKVQDPINLGLIYRSAVAFGINQIALSKHCVKFYNSKSIRVSQGYFFYLNILEIDEIEKFCINLKNKNYKFITTFLNKENSTYLNSFSIDKNQKYIYLFGQEGNGLSKFFKKYSDKNILIKTTKVESLNLSIAVSIFLSKVN